ncbi:PKD domain-containing protein [Flavobacterium sp.]|uniref:PKD domain-containing protein n=1 Tax=Flavobacterium sp. TaxID=239 RepID=UPI003752A04C
MKQLYLIIALLFYCALAFSNDVLLPTATITGGTTVCQNAANPVITFTGAGGTAPYTFTYSINGMTQPIISSIGSNSSVTVNINSSVSGTFVYSLVSVQDTSGTQTQTGSATVIINALPTQPTITTNGVTTFCEGNNVLISTSNNSSLTYQWNLNGVTIPNATSANYSAINSGNYSVSVTNSNGCISTSMPISVTVYPKIEPVLGANGTTNTAIFQNLTYFTRCINSITGVINIVNQTLNQNQVTSYTLNWGDSSPIVNLPNFTSNLTHTYNQGFYTLIISLTTNQGCIYSKNYGIFVGNTPSGSLGNPGNLSGCSPKTIIFPIIAPSENVPGTQYIIDFGDGQSITYIHPNAPSSVSHTYTTSSCGNNPTGTGSIPNSFVASMTITNPCFPPALTTVGPIIISTPPTPNFSISPNPGCINSTINILNTSNPGSIIGQSGCISPPSLYWTISPATGWSASGLGNNGGNATDIDSWSNGVNAPTINFNTIGTYSITLYIGNSCDIKSIIKTICIEPPLTPQFTLNTTSGCTPLAITATNNTVVTNSCTTPTYNWQVTYTAANCGTAIAPIPNQTSANATYNFTEAGNYAIKLTVTNSCGSFNTMQTVTVKKPPTVSIAPINNSCGTATINPIANVPACVQPSNALTYAWSFPSGNPSTANTLNPGTINYSTTGTFQVSLIVTNECGASNTATQSFTVNESPTITNSSLSQTICSGTATTLVNLTANPSNATFTWTATATTGVTGFFTSGTNTIPVQTISTSNTSVGTVTYVITPKIETCTGAMVNYVINVNPAAQVNQPPPISFCNNTTTNAINFTTTNPTGTTFSWTNSNTSIGLAASGNGNLPSFTATNTTSNPITATITVTPSFSGGSTVCNGVSKTFIITVNPTGQVNQPSDLPKCNGDNVTTNFSTSNSGTGTTTYNWTNNTPAIGLPSSGNGNLNFTATNTSTSILVATITVTPTYSLGNISCIGTPKTFTITINPSAQVNQPNTISVCNGSTIPTINFSTSNTVGTTSYNWTNSNTSIGLSMSGTGDIPSFTAINTGNSLQVATIIVTPTYLVGSTSCSGATKQFTISVSPNASVNTIIDKYVCNGNNLPTIQFSSATTGGTISYNWTNDTPSIGLPATGNGNILSFTAINTGLLPVTATISVTPTFTSGSLNCIGTPQNFTITVNPSGQVNTINTIEVCNGNSIPTIVFTTNNTGGTTTYSWTNSNTSIGLAGSGIGSILSFNATNTSSTPLIATVTITPTFTNGGVNCTGTNQTFTIKVNPSPTVTILGTIDVCLNATNPPITFTGSAGNAPYTFTYNINGGTNQTIATLTGNSVTLNAPTNALGIYTYNLINVQDSNATSCLNTISQSAIVTVNAAPTINLQPIPNQSVCVGGSIVNPLLVAYNNGTGTPTYQWYSNSINSTSDGTEVGTNSNTYLPPIYLTAGIYYYYVKISFNGNGCGEIISTIAQVIVVDDPLVTAQPLLTQTLCQNETPTNLTITTSGGIGTNSYQWFQTTTSTNSGGTLVGTNSTSFTPPTNTVGTFYYYCEVTQTGIACSVKSNSSTIVINTSPTILNQPISSTVCQDGTATTLSFTYSNGVGTPTYQWYSNSINSNSNGNLIPTETSSTFNPPSNNIGIFYYYCVIKFPDLVGSCSNIFTDVAVVTINPQSTIENQPLLNQTICIGGSIAIPLSVTFINGTGTESYQWYSNTTNSNSTGNLISGATNSTYIPPVFTATGIFYYYVKISFTGNGCGTISSNVAEINVINDPIVISQPIPNQTLCQNAIPINLIVTATGGIGIYNYQWYSNTINSTTNGIILNGEINAIFTPSTTNNGTIYYYCEITQPNGIGCNVTSQTSEIIINVAPAISDNPISSTVCLGNNPILLSVNYINGVGTPTYQWFSNTVNSNVGGAIFNNENTATFNPPSTLAGIFYYYCQISFPTLYGGCEIITSNTAIVTIEQVPVIVSQNLTICSNSTFTITPTNSSSDIVPASTTYTWSTPTINPIESITGSSSQNIPQNSISQTLINTTTSPATATYTITPKSGNCIGTDFTVTITINPSTNPNAVVTNSTCYGINNGSISTNITGGIPFSTNPPYTILWTGPNSFTSNASSISNLIPGLYNLSITDAGGCPISTNYTITEPLEMILTTDVNNNITCFGNNNGAISISVTGGTGTYFYVWTKNGTNFATTEDITNLSPATYIVSVSDDNNCPPKTLTFTITEPPILSVNLVSQTNVDCYGFATGAITISTTGGTPLETSPGIFNYTYSWTGANGYASSSQNLTILIAGTYNLVVTDNLGCTKNLSVTITQSTEIIITATTTPIECYGDNDATINTTISGGNAPYQIQWSNLAIGLNQNNLAPGNYTITVTDTFGCIKSSTINIPSPPLFDVNPVITNISCFGANDGSIVLNFVGGIAPVNLVWSDGSPAGITRNNLSAGTYSVIITDAKPCTISRTFTIIEPQLLVLSANTTNALDCNNANSGGINLLVSGGTPPFNYVWNNGTTTEDLLNIAAGNYSVTVTDSRSCVKSAQYSITRPSPIVVTVATTTVANCATNSVTQNFTAQVSGGVPPFQFNWSSGTVSGLNNEIMTTTQNGLVTLTATDAIGCSSNYSLNVLLPVLGNPTFSQNSIGFTSYGIYSILDPIQFNSTITGDYISVLWDFGDGTFSNELNPIHTYLIPNDYYLVTQTVTYHFGCIYVSNLALKVEKGYLLVMPTAFTPDNNDGVNDTLRPVSKGLKNIRLDIYDTWGSLIYSETGEVLIGWNGKIKNINSENGNYYAKVSAETFYGTIINENQTFVLIK